MDTLASAVAATKVHITSFTPHDNSLTHPQLLFLQQNNYINVLNRSCKRKNCTSTHGFVSSKRVKEGWETNCIKHTSYLESIRVGSFFSSFKLPISRIIYIIHHLASGCSTSSIKKLIKTVDRESITGILTKLQKLMIPIVQQRKPKFDTGELVEIDEIFVPWSIPGTQTDSELAGKKGTWLLGIINRDRTKLWIEPIKNRGKQEIARVLDSVLPADSAYIFTDALSTYSYLEHDHIHFVINKAQLTKI